ncbi:SOS response-associated peptidase [Novosphingobium percolationis]|uniref:SOS response-associated peptidase n=1 Tax=Novosphingobium percolationis TaxID=2871811 RepID=UPI001CD29AB2|nr:SOS response-associated peptidase family protein [Novosphingobium percolationis]
MCNLYKMRANVAEVANLFNARAHEGVNFGDEVYPGYPGLVVAQGEVRTMTWGFPLQLTGKQGQKLKPKPVNNAREDKLSTAFWRDSFAKRRCLIPVSAWAEAEGPKGSMTRTWYSITGAELFAVAGIWRPTQEWGDAYSMVMVDGCPQMADVHDRMPVVLTPQDWSTWLTAEPEAAFALCQTCPQPLEVDRTDEPWAKLRAPKLC